MARAGVTTAPANPGPPLDALARLAKRGPERAAQVAAASAMFVQDPAARTVEPAERHALCSRSS